MQTKPLFVAILVSWGIAFFEYCFQVPANRLGAAHFELGQLKVIQEVITMIVFMIFSVFYMKKGISANFIYASLCLVAASFFMFRK